MRIRDGDPSDERIAALNAEELQAWSEAHAVGGWEPNDTRLDPPPTEAITIRVPRELLQELRIEAAVRRQPWPRYAKDLLLLAVRQMQATRVTRRGGELRPPSGPDRGSGRGG